MAAIFENFSKVGVVYSLDTLGVENFDEIALSLTVKDIEAILCFCIFGPPKCKRIAMATAEER